MFDLFFILSALFRRTLKCVCVCVWGGGGGGGRVNDPLTHVVTSSFVVQLLHLLRVKGLYFFNSPSISKENTEDFKKNLMNVSHKFFSFDPLFLGTKKKQYLRSLKIFVQPLYIHSCEKWSRNLTFC